MLKPEAAGWAVVLVGHWNTSIFSPKWIAGRLTSSQDVQVEVPVGGVGLAPRLHFDAIYLYLNPQILTIAPARPEVEILEQVERVAVRLLKDLPHTPVTGVGINFQFRDSDPTESILKGFNFTDAVALSRAGFTSKSTTLTRRLEGNGRTVNFTIANDDADHVVYDFNYHADVTSADHAATHLSQGLKSYHAHALDLLARTYEYKFGE